MKSVLFYNHGPTFVYSLPDYAFSFANSRSLRIDVLALDTFNVASGEENWIGRAILRMT